MKKYINHLYRYWTQGHWRLMHQQAKKDNSRVANAMLDIPLELQCYWREHGPKEFPGMPTSEKSWAWAVRGLLTYFAIAASSNKQTVLPSRAADSVWHAWLAWDAEHLRNFQMRHFNKSMSHLETKDMQSNKDTANALPRTWAMASKYEGLPILSGKIPFIFIVDRVLKMPQGWYYEHNTKSKQIEVADIDRSGVHKSRLVPGLTAASLLGLGLIAADEVQAWEKTNAAIASSNQGGSCGIGITTISCGSNSSGDGDGGSSCGGGCGGD